MKKTRPNRIELHASKVTSFDVWARAPVEFRRAFVSRKLTIEAYGDITLDCRLEGSRLWIRERGVPSSPDAPVIPVAALPFGKVRLGTPDGDRLIVVTLPR